MRALSAVSAALFFIVLRADAADDPPGVRTISVPVCPAGIRNFQWVVENRDSLALIAGHRISVTITAITKSDPDLYPQRITGRTTILYAPIVSVYESTAGAEVGSDTIFWDYYLCSDGTFSLDSIGEPHFDTSFIGNPDTSRHRLLHYSSERMSSVPVYRGAIGWAFDLDARQFGDTTLRADSLWTRVSHISPDSPDVPIVMRGGTLGGSTLLGSETATIRFEPGGIDSIITPKGTWTTPFLNLALAERGGPPTSPDPPECSVNPALDVLALRYEANVWFNPRTSPQYVSKTVRPGLPVPLHYYPGTSTDTIGYSHWLVLRGLSIGLDFHGLGGRRIAGFGKSNPGTHDFRPGDEVSIIIKGGVSGLPRSPAGYVAQIDSSISNVTEPVAAVRPIFVVSPNPLPLGTGTDGAAIALSPLPSVCEIILYNELGELVGRRRHSGGSSERWLLERDTALRLASGIALIEVRSPSGTISTSRVIVER